ncbi:MAG: hypothetical protein WC178_03525 [Candidatus Paceibacterota bacterium]|jgi:hypothetical protein
MAEITKITMYHKSNFVTFNDTDIMTDYFHNYSLGQKETTEWLIQDGADLITVHVVNNDQDIPAVRRLKQICKKCGYEYTDKSHMHHYEIQNVDEYVLEYELRRVTPSKFIVSWWMPEAQKFGKSEEMDKENATKFSKELRAKRVISVSMKRVIPSQ